MHYIMKHLVANLEYVSAFATTEEKIVFGAKIIDGGYLLLESEEASAYMDKSRSA